MKIKMNLDGSNRFQRDLSTSFQKSFKKVENAHETVLGTFTVRSSPRFKNERISQFLPVIYHDN
jgi:hypothetical protein